MIVQPYLIYIWLIYEHISLATKLVLFQRQCCCQTCVQKVLITNKNKQSQTEILFKQYVLLLRSLSTQAAEWNDNTSLCIDNTMIMTHTWRIHHGLPIRRKIVTRWMDLYCFALGLPSATLHKSIMKVTIFLLIDKPWWILSLQWRKTIKCATN